MSQTMMSGENRFVFVSPMYNAEATLPRMLHSLYGQSYDNWHLVLIDDVSNDVNVASCKDWLRRFESINVGKVTAVWNNTKRWEVANVLTGISMCNDTDIVCRIDADDWLTDLDALAIINTAYEQTGCEVLWTAHRWGFSDRSISADMPTDADPYKYPWVSSHLKTFRKYLLNGVPIQNFENMHGELVKRCGDQAIFLPVLNKTKHRVYLPRTMYHYTIDEQGGAVYQTDDARFQKQEADHIRARGYVADGIPWETVFV